MRPRYKLAVRSKLRGNQSIMSPKQEGSARQTMKFLTSRWVELCKPKRSHNTTITFHNRHIFSELPLSFPGNPDGWKHTIRCKPLKSYIPVSTVPPPYLCPQHMGRNNEYEVQTKYSLKGLEEGERCLWGWECLLLWSSDAGTHVKARCGLMHSCSSSAEGVDAASRDLLAASLT